MELSHEAERGTFVHLPLPQPLPLADLAELAQSRLRGGRGAGALTI